MNGSMLYSSTRLPFSSVAHCLCAFNEIKWFHISYFDYCFAYFLPCLFLNFDGDLKCAHLQLTFPAIDAGGMAICLQVFPTFKQLNAFSAFPATRTMG